MWTIKFIYLVLLMGNSLLASGYRDHNLWNKHNVLMKQFREQQYLDKLLKRNHLEEESRNLKSFSPLAEQPLRDSEVIKESSELGSSSGSGECSAFGSGAENDDAIQKDLQLLEEPDILEKLSKKGKGQEHLVALPQKQSLDFVNLADKRENEHEISLLSRGNIPNLDDKKMDEIEPNFTIKQKKSHFHLQSHPSPRRNTFFKKFLLKSMLNKFKKMQSERRRVKMDQDKTYGQQYNH